MPSETDPIDMLIFALETGNIDLALHCLRLLSVTP